MKLGAFHIGRRILLGMLLSIPLWLTGCIGVYPSLTMHEDYGRKLNREMVNFIHPGITTRAEVIAQLGTNYLSLPQDRAMAYPWETKGLAYEWYFFAFGPYGGGSRKLETQFNPTGSHWQAFFIAFDEHAVVRSTRFKQLSVQHSLDEQLDHWQSRLPAPKRAPLQP